MNGSSAAAWEHLRAIVSPERYPRLVEVLSGQADERLQVELLRLLQSRFRPRAERRSVKRTGRLSHEGYDEVVLIRDISASGVRVRVPKQQPFDVAHAAFMTLSLKLEHAVHELPVTLVRVADTDPEGIEVACRFLNPEVDNAGIADRLRSLFFAK